jgi:hypothetical protein
MPRVDERLLFAAVFVLKKNSHGEHFVLGFTRYNMFPLNTLFVLMMKLETRTIQY